MSGYLGGGTTGGGGGGGALTSDADHGNRGGGPLHSVAISNGANGFMTGADKAKLNGIEAGADATTFTKIQSALGGNAGATAGLVFKSDGAGGGSMVVDTQNISHRITVGKSGDVDYTTIKGAVDYVITQSPSATNLWLIEVYPGIYSEAPMTLPSGVFVSGATGQISTPVIITASNSAADLFTLTGGVLCGVRLTGVTDPVRCLVRVSDPTKPGVLLSCSLLGCSYGLIVDSGATASIFALSCSITGANQAITGAALKADNGSILISVGTFSAPAGFDGLYSSNMIEKGIYVTNGGSLEASSCAFRIFPHDANQAAIVGDGGSTLSVMSTHFSNNATALLVGASGSNTSLSCQSISLKSNTTNFKILSSTGTIFANATADLIKSSITAGGKLSGIVQQRNLKTVDLVGNIYAKFDSGKEADLLTFLEDQMSTGVTSGGITTATSGLGVSVTAGSGWIHRSSTNNDIRYVTWGISPVTTTANSTNYIYYQDTSDTIVSQLSAPGENDILLATVVSGASAVRYVHVTISQAADRDAILYSYLLSNRKIILDTGLGVSQGSSAVKITVASGSYYRALYKNSYGGSVDAGFSYFYGSGGSTEVASQTVLNATQYDSSGVLTTMTAANYKSDTVYLTSDGRISIIYGNVQYTLLQDAVNAPTSAIPSFLEESGILLASIIIQKTTGIVQIIDRRPVGALTTGGGNVSDHGLLSGLSDDDHPQYILANGSRAMAGNLQMGGYAITNVGTVDGVTVSAHASRHLPGGVDALTTAAPVAVLVGASVAEGVAASFARSDHQHGIGVAAPVTIGIANASGGASTVSRSDHVHAHGAQTDGSLHAVATGSVAGFLSATDKTRLDTVIPGSPVTVTVGASTSDGVSAAYARGDHQHGIITGTPATIGTSNNAGVATTVAASDHVHSHGNQTVGTLHAVATGSVAGFLSSSDKNRLDAIVPGSVVAPVIGGTSDGAATSYSRSDHQHGLTVGSPVAIGTSNSDGVATSLSRSDHVHAHGSQTDGSLHGVATQSVAGFLSTTDKTRFDNLTPGTVVAVALGATANDGAAVTYARSDHQHNVTVAAPSTIGTTNSAGVATTSVRSDHVHAHGTQFDGSLHAIATNSTSGFMSAGDKIKLDGIVTASRGAATMNFGSTPGTNVVITTVTGQGNIASNSLIRVSIMGDTTAEHNAYEHLIADIKVSSGNIVVGVGFDIVAVTTWRLTGTFTVRWSWS